MKSFLLRRIMISLLTLFGVSLIAFMMLHLIPGDPARILAGVDATDEEVEALRDRLGLNDPLPQQFLSYLLRLISGDMGLSMRTGRPVFQEISSRLPVTVLLTLLALAVTIVLGIPAGVIAATRSGWMKEIPFLLTVLLSCMPVFWTGMLLVLVFAVWNKVLPPGGSQGFAYFILPALALGVNAAGLLARLVRSGLSEVMSSDYIRTARAKGMRRGSVIYRHALRNGLIPIITVLGLQLGQLLGGAILTETLFALNGIGRYLVLSIAFRDYVVVQGIVLFIAIAFIAINLMVDLLYGIIDPRVQYS